MALTLSKKAMAVKPSSTLAITAAAKKLKSEGVDVVGFGAGEPDFDTPDNIKEAAILAIQSGFTKYTPAAGTDDLRKAVCEKLKSFNGLDYEPEQVVISNGGKHSLTNIFEVLLNPGDEVIIPAPYWLSYPEIVKLADGIPVYVTCSRENDYKITARELEAACNEHTKAVILNSPNNPTGSVYSKEELQALAEVIVKKDIYVVSDEMYENLVYDDNRHVSIASLGEEIYRRTITCSGMAKSYSMTGWRIGYTAASKEIADLMSSVQSHQTSNPNSIAQKAAVEALRGPQTMVEVMKKEFDRRRKDMYNRLLEMPYIKTNLPAGAFYVFVDVSGALGKRHKGEVVDSVEQLASILIHQYQVAVVPCADFGFASHIRLSYAVSMEQIHKGLDRLEAFLSELCENE